MISCVTGRHVRHGAIPTRRCETSWSDSAAGCCSGAILVVDADDRLLGIFTDSDLARLFENRREGLLDRPIADAMTANPVRATSGATVADAIDALKSRKLSELPVGKFAELAALQGVDRVGDGRAESRGTDGGHRVGDRPVEQAFATVLEQTGQSLSVKIPRADRRHRRRGSLRSGVRHRRVGPRRFAPSRGNTQLQTWDPSAVIFIDSAEPKAEVASRMIQSEVLGRKPSQPADRKAQGVARTAINAVELADGASPSGRLPRSAQRHAKVGAAAKGAFGSFGDRDQGCPIRFTSGINRKTSSVSPL